MVVHLLVRNEEDDQILQHSSYSLVRLVVLNTEELISRPFMGLLKIRWLLQDRMRTWDPHFWVAVLNRSLLFCPSHTHSYRSSMGIPAGFVLKQVSCICLVTNTLDLFQNKSCCNAR